MVLQEIINALESEAPLNYQESYDNSGLQVGDRSMSISGILVSLDVTEAILEEANQRNCNLIVAHHPLIFSGLKSLTGKSYVERIVTQAIKNDIAIYAIHTNLDNMLHGVNAKISERLSLKNTRILAPVSNKLSKLFTYVPLNFMEQVKQALFNAGAGEIGAYSECSFSMMGVGSFKPGSISNPTIGKAGGKREMLMEQKLEVLVPADKITNVLNALKAAHPYEEVAYEIIALQNQHQEVGAGMVGDLEKPMKPLAFLEYLKLHMKADCIRYTALPDKLISKIAVCGGSGSFLLQQAIGAKADVFITGDYKYHQFFDADNKIVIADIGHYESEQFTKELIVDILNKKFPNFATLLTDLSTNPIKYFC